MFGIGMPELLVILVVALFIVGPKKLPDLAKNLGRGIAELKKSASDVMSEVTDHEDFKDLKSIKHSLDDAAKIVRKPLDAVASSIKEDLKKTIDIDPKSPTYQLEPHVDGGMKYTPEADKDGAEPTLMLQDSPASQGGIPDSSSDSQDPVINVSSDTSSDPEPRDKNDA